MAKIRFQTVDNQNKKNKIRFQLIDEPQKNEDNASFNLPQNIKNNVATAQQLVQQRAAEQAQRDAESKRIVSLPFKSDSIVAIDKDRERMQKDADIILKNNQKFATLANQVNLKNKKGGTLPQLKYNEAAKPLTLGEKIAYGMKDTFLGEAADEVAGIGWNAAKAVGELGDDLLDTGLQLGTSQINPYYWFNPDKLESHQNIAKDIVKEDATQRAIEAYGLKGAQDYVNENSALFNEDSLGGTVVREATKILLESQLAPSMPGAVKGTKLFSKAGLKQFGRSAAGIGGTMGISAYGNALEQAYNNGATREQASKYAAMNSALEVATEMMFAGLGGFKGKGALDDVVQSKIASKYGNKLKGKILSKVADVLGEETEELVSWGIDPLLQKMTYAADEELKWDWNELGDTFTQTALSVLLLGCLPSNAEDSRKKIREQYVDYYMESHEGATKKEAKEALKRLEKEAEKVSKQVEKAEKQQKGLFKNINEEVSSKGSSDATLSLEEIIRNVDPEKAKEIDKMKEQKSEETTEEVKEEKPTEESKVKTSLTELVEETTPKTEQQEAEQPKKDFNEQVKDIAKQYNVDAKTLKSSGIKDIDKIETVAKAMNKQNYNTTVKDLAKKYGVGVSVLKSTKITDAKELESVAKTLSTKTEAEIEAPKKAKELPKKETKQVKTEETKVEKTETEKLPEPTEATQEDIDHLFKKTPHMTEGEKQAKAQTKTQNKNQLYESAKYFNEQGSTLGAKFNIKNSDIQKALDIYIQYKEAGGKKTIENLEVLRKKPSVVEKAKENVEKTKELPKKEQTTKEEFASRLTSIMNTQKEIDDELSKDRRLPKAVSVENTQTKKTEKTEKVAKETKKTIKPVKEVEEAKTTKKAESLPKTDEQIDAEIKEMAQKGVTTTKADINTRQMFMESRARTLDRQISNMRSSGNAGDINTFIDNNIKQYDQLLADGGKKIPAYEEFKTKYQPKKEDSTKNAQIEKADKVIEKLKEKTTIAAMSNRNSVKVIKPEDFNKKSKSMKVSNEKPINIADVANKIDLYEDDIDMTETPKNSNLLTEYKELPTKKTPVDNDIISQMKTQIVNQQHPIEEMDKKNRNYEGEQAYVRYRLSPSEGAVQVTRAQTDLDGKAVGKPILQLKKEYFDGLNKEAQELLTVMAHLRRDIGIHDYQTNYAEDGEYVDNVLPEYSYEYKKEALEILKKEYPALANHLDKLFEDIRTYYKNENANLVESGYLPKTTDISVKYAKEKMNMTQDEINANRNKDGSVKVPTVDYYSAMNPDYFHIVRVTDKNSSNISTTKSSVSVKGPQGLKEGASKYDIQPIFDGMADGAINNRKLMRLNQLLETIAKNDKTFENNQIPPTDLIEIDENGNEKIVKMGNDYYIKYRENGKNKAAKITKSMYESINNGATIVDKLFNMDKEDIKNLDTKKKKALFKTLKGVRAVNKFEKMALTTLKPAFVIGNTMKDFGEAVINTNYNIPRFTAEYIKSAIELPANTKYAREFKNTGLYQDAGYYTYTNKKGIEKQNPIVRNTVGRMEQMAAYSEALARYTEYKIARKKGLSVDEAARQAKRVTVNFDRRGKLVGTMDRNFTKFIGAAQAGMNTMYDNIIGNNIYSAQSVMKKLHGEELTTRDIQELKKSGKMLVRVTLAGMLPSLYNSLMFGSDDDKEWLENNVPEYIRDKAYIVRVGKNNYIPIYYARSQSVYKTALEETINKDSLGTKANKIYKSFMENIAPNNPIETTKTYELISALKNEDYYKNKLYEDDDTLLEKVKKVALKRAKSYGGLLYDVGDWINTSEKSSTNKIPLVNILVKDTNDLVNVRQQSYNYSNKFWDKRNKYKESKDVEKNIKYKSMDADYKEYVKPIADQIKIAKETGASDKELKKLYAKQRDTYRSLLENEGDVYGYTGGYYYNGHNYKYTVDKNGKVSYREQK